MAIEIFKRVAAKYRGDSVEVMAIPPDDSYDATTISLRVRVVFGSMGREDVSVYLTPENAREIGEALIAANALAEGRPF